MGWNKTRIRKDMKIKQVNADGYLSAMTCVPNAKIGVLEQQLANYRLAPEILTRLYMSNRIVKKIVDIPAQEATKNGYEIEGDEEDLVCQELDRLNFDEHATLALKWSRLFGGSAIYIVANDGGEPDEALNDKNISEIVELRVYDRLEVSVARRYSDVNSLNYNKPELYNIYPAMGGSFIAHESRLLVFDGEQIPSRERAANDGWGGSVLQGLIDRLNRNENGENLGIGALEKLSQGILKLDGLTDMLGSDDGEEIVRKRIQLIDHVRNIYHSIAVDSADDYDIKNISLSQVPEIMDRFALSLSAAAGISFTRLFGRSPAGMNATGQSDLENDYNTVKAFQQSALRNNLEKFARLIMLQKNGPFKGSELESWKLEFKPLWLPSEKEQAETEKLEADADKIKAETLASYIEFGVMSASEARKEIAKKYDLQGDIEPPMPYITEGL